MSAGTPFIIPSVKREILVAASQEKAFKAWTIHHDAWYPRHHHIGKTPMQQAVLECKPGGRWYEIGEDGTQCEWGKVLAWAAFASLSLSAAVGFMYFPARIGLVFALIALLTGIANIFAR